MRPEILQSMLYYYVKEKSVCDETDGSLQGESLDNRNVHAHFGPSLAQSPTSLVVTSSSVTLTPAQTAKVTAVAKELSKQSTLFSTSQPEKSALKFKKPCVFVSPEDETVVLRVIRTPNSLNTDLKVKWKTLDRTAVSGSHYVASVGEFVFDKESAEKEIKVQLIPSKEDNDLRFQVELELDKGVFKPLPVTVNINNIKKLYDDEKQVLNNILHSHCTSVEDVGHLLKENLNIRTFHATLSYVCSQADSLPLEVGFALELCRLCLPRMRYDSMIKVLHDFFRNDNDEL